MGLLIENATGNALADEFQMRIFDPTGMTSSSLPGFDRPHGILRSYALIDGQTVDVTDSPFADLGDRGVVSTTGYMIRFMKALLIDGTLVPEYQSAALEEYFATERAPEDSELIGHGGGTAGTGSITLFHPATGTIFSAAETMRYGRELPGGEVFRAFESIFDNPAWNVLYGDADKVSFATTAAEVEVNEIVGTDGDAESYLPVDGATLSFDGHISDLATERFSFEDSSILLVANETGSEFHVGKDARSAAKADNQLIGLEGDDYLFGGRGDDKVSGGAGDDTLIGKRSDESISGGGGKITGNRVDDQLLGGNGNDNISGGRGDDDLSGGAGDDILRGRRGNDTLDGSAGNDILVGGRGADTFVFAGDNGDNIIKNFVTGKDQIDLTALNLTFEDLKIFEVREGRGFEVLFGDSSLIINAKHGELAEADFVF